MYGRELVDLRKESRWEFLNTLFSVSEAVAYMQVCHRVEDHSAFSDVDIFSYNSLFKVAFKS